MVFDPLDNNVQPTIGYQIVRCHMTFDVKMEDFNPKAWLVAGEHMTDVPRTVTYTSVISQETIHIVLTMAALNALNDMAADIMNMFVTAPNKEKIWTLLGPKFGKD